MNRYKNRIKILYVFAFFAVFTYIVNIFIPMDKNVVKTNSTKNDIYIETYLLSEDHLLIPISIPTEKESINEMIVKMFSYMNGEKIMKGLNPLLEQSSKINHVEVKENILYLYFDVLEYKEKNELKVLEALSWLCTQFEDVKQVKLFLKEKELTHMPYANTPIPNILNRDLGINNFENNGTELHKTKTVTLYYTKEINDISYYIPISKRINQNEKIENLKYLDEISITSSLSSPFIEDHIKVLKVVKDQNKIKVTVSKQILNENKEVNKVAYTLLVLSINEIYQNVDVEVYVGDVDISLTMNDLDIIINKFIL